jgi:hypothetical protein
MSDSQGKHCWSFADILQHSTALSGTHLGEECLLLVEMTLLYLFGIFCTQIPALRSAANTLLHRKPLQQHRRQMAQELRMSQWVKRAHTPAGAVTTKLAISAGHLRVLLQGKVVTGLALLEDEAYGVSNYDHNTRIKIVGGGHLQ